VGGKDEDLMPGVFEVRDERLNGRADSIDEGRVAFGKDSNTHRTAAILSAKGLRQES
jgi:hypothetical protein